MLNASFTKQSSVDKVCRPIASRTKLVVVKARHDGPCNEMHLAAFNLGVALLRLAPLLLLLNNSLFVHRSLVTLALALALAFAI